MDIVLLTVIWQVALIFLDDIFIFSSSVVNHLDNMQAELGKLLRAIVSFELENCLSFEDIWLL